jgi:hypothetical protein
MQELNIQIDKFEADIETLSASLKKKKSDKDVSIEMNNELKGKSNRYQNTEN